MTCNNVVCDRAFVALQSWGGLDPNSRTSLGPYAPHVPLNIAREDLRRSFAAGRSFTYAEKIKLMNKLNDEDALITREHVKGAGTLDDSTTCEAINFSFPWSRSSSLPALWTELESHKF